MYHYNLGLATPYFGSTQGINKHSHGKWYGLVLVINDTRLYLPINFAFDNSCFRAYFRSENVDAVKIWKKHTKNKNTNSQFHNRVPQIIRNHSQNPFAQAKIIVIQIYIDILLGPQKAGEIRINGGKIEPKYGEKKLRSFIIYCKNQEKLSAPYQCTCEK